MYLNKKRFKYVYYDNARTLINVKWGEVYAMADAPPGGALFNDREVGRSITIDAEGRDEFGTSGRNTGNDVEIQIKQEDFYYLADRDGEAYTGDSVRWTDEEIAQIQNEVFVND